MREIRKEYSATFRRIRRDRLSHLSVCVCSAPLLLVGSRPVGSAVSHERRRPGAVGRRAPAGAVNQPRGRVRRRRRTACNPSGARRSSGSGALPPSLLFSYPGEALAGDGASGGGGGSGSVNSAVVGIVVGSRFDDVVVGRFHELAVGDGGGGGFILVLSTWIVLVLKSAAGRERVERVRVALYC